MAKQYTDEKLSLSELGEMYGAAALTVGKKLRSLGVQVRACGNFVPEHDSTTIVCSRCAVRQPYDNFYDADSIIGKSGVCKTCEHSADMFQKYGLTPEEYEKMVEVQGNRCFYCRCVPTCENNRGHDYLAVDHDHELLRLGIDKRKTVRHLLCHACNVAIGFVHYNPHVLRAMAADLELWQKEHGTEKSDPRTDV